MRCLVCEQLHREHTLACQAEATGTLKLRGKLTPPAQREATIADPLQEKAQELQEKAQELQEKVLSSRKQQLKIRSRMEEHKALAHSA